MSAHAAKWVAWIVLPSLYLGLFFLGPHGWILRLTASLVLLMVGPIGVRH